MNSMAIFVRRYGGAYVATAEGIRRSRVMSAEDAARAVADALAQRGRHRTYRLRGVTEGTHAWLYVADFDPEVAP